ncbi:uncharacterized protein LOC106638600 [Copidosoma floridanum]|uniref:uncharacterized protein LOC106638600 n=1 Tax=Copidosoma floridanum TaxID=29053 RepID=UPI0006C96F09|nr:uncharacterized protein LOC106638600 [Copidosoma floridanum]
MKRFAGGPGPSSSNKFIGCVGKCTSGISISELDRITDHVQHALDSTKGRSIFKRYLEQGRRRTDLACLQLYEQICEYIDNDERNRIMQKDPSVESLACDVNLVLSAAEDLDDVTEIDLALLERYTEALDKGSREAMLDVLHDTKVRIVGSLVQAHKGFRTYVRQPCPETKA